MDSETHRHMYALACTHGCTYPPAIYFMWNYLFRQGGGGPETNRMSRGVWTVTVMTKILSLVLSGHAEVRIIPLNVGVICLVMSVPLMFRECLCPAVRKAFLFVVVFV